MKKLLILMVGMLLCAVAAYAQETQPYKVYCEIVSSSRILSDKVNVDLDFGQASSFVSDDRRLYDENGKAIIFNSMLDAANYMARRGWELEEAFPVISISSGDSGSPSYHWIMSKLVTDDAQITEGLITGGMRKGK